MMRVRTDQFLAIEGVTAEQAVEECHLTAPSASLCEL